MDGERKLFFKQTSVTTVCPLCGSEVQRKTINEHLDNVCAKFQKTKGGDTLRKSRKVDEGTKRSVIIIDDSESDAEETDDNRSVNVALLDDIRERLSVTKLELYEESEMDEWRMKLNPFRCFGLNKHSGNPFSKASFINGEHFKTQCSRGLQTTSYQDVKQNIVSSCQDVRQNTVSSCQDVKQNNVSLCQDVRQNTVLSCQDVSKITDDSKPYYLENFRFVAKKVLEESSHLFDDGDLLMIKKQSSLTVKSLRLFIRLYLRKRGWFRCDKITYPEINNDLTKEFEELILNGYLVDEASLSSLNTVVDLLAAEDVRKLASTFQLSKKASTPKSELVKLLMKQCTQQRSLLSFTNKTGCSMRELIMKKAKSYVGRCVKLNDKVSFVYARLFTCFGLTMTHHEDVMYNTGYDQIFHLLRVNQGAICYPRYTVTKTHSIFKTPQQLSDYTSIVLLEREFDERMARKSFQHAHAVYLTVLEKLKSLCTVLLDDAKRKELPCLQLPPYLACYSEAWLIVRLCGKSVEVLEKLSKYEEAVALIEVLLAQNLLCHGARGALWERLAIDLERHLKNRTDALASIKRGLNDKYVRSGQRLALQQRFERLSKNKMCNHCEFVESPLEETLNAPVFLEGSLHSRAVFSNDQDQALSHVEDYVLLHYKNNGFPRGLHAEGSAVTSLFMLFFWDVVFAVVPDAFHCEYQNSPVDIYRDDFYGNRKAAIDNRLNELYHCSDEEIRVAIESSWQQNYGLECLGLNWGLFHDAKDAADLAVCLGALVLAGISELFSKDLRRRRGGFPDLIVWNTTTKRCKIVEVKGPGDKLSTKQVVWLDVLNYLGADASVCYVKGGGDKRKRDSA